MTGLARKVTDALMSPGKQEQAALVLRRRSLTSVGVCVADDAVQRLSKLP